MLLLLVLVVVLVVVVLVVVVVVFKERGRARLDRRRVVGRLEPARERRRRPRVLDRARPAREHAPGDGRSARGAPIFAVDGQSKMTCNYKSGAKYENRFSPAPVPGCKTYLILGRSLPKPQKAFAPQILLSRPKSFARSAKNFGGLYFTPQIIRA